MVFFTEEGVDDEVGRGLARFLFWESYEYVDLSRWDLYAMSVRRKSFVGVEQQE